jgi:hypothetical protein
MAGFSLMAREVAADPALAAARRRNRDFSVLKFHANSLRWQHI